MTNPPIEQYLASQAFFSGLSPDVITFLARCASEQAIAPGQVLFRQGERAHHFYLGV